MGARRGRWSSEAGVKVRRRAGKAKTGVQAGRSEQRRSVSWTNGSDQAGWDQGTSWMTKKERLLVVELSDGQKESTRAAVLALWQLKGGSLAGLHPLCPSSHCCTNLFLGGGQPEDSHTLSSLCLNNFISCFVFPF